MLAPSQLRTYTLRMATLKKGRGHPDVFTSAQNKALRDALREYKTAKGVSQAEIARRLGVGQQAVGRLLTSDTAGFSYVTGTRVARLLDFVGVDTFFRSRGVTLPSEPPHARSA